MNITIPEIIGFTGVALLIITYALLQLERIDPKGFCCFFFGAGAGAGDGAAAAAPNNPCGT